MWTKSQIRKRRWAAYWKSRFRFVSQSRIFSRSLFRVRSNSDPRRLSLDKAHAPLAARPAKSVKGVRPLREKIAQILHVKIADRRGLGLALGLADQILHLVLNAEAKRRNALVEERFTGARHSRRQVPADVEPEKTAQDNDTKNQRERAFEGAARNPKANVEEKNE